MTKRIAMSATAFLTAGCSIFTFGVDPEPINTELMKDLSKLQGLWVNDRDHEQWFIQRDRLSRFVNHRRLADLRIEVERAGTSKHLDLMPIEASKEDDLEAPLTVAKGLYALEGDRLDVAFTCKFYSDRDNHRAIKYTDERPDSISSERGNVVTARFVRQDRKNISAFKMSRIVWALLDFENAHKHFPSATILGPDGKTPHSWRVEVLPFLQRKDIYDRYKMNEPWNSESNLALVKEAADLFSVPGDEPDSNCGYFLITGPKTAFDANEPPTRIRSVIDGLSHTIGLVESKREIPWTKPEDIPYDANGPLPSLGGYFENGFHVGYLDSHTYFVSDDADESFLRATFTKAGREHRFEPNN